MTRVAPLSSPERYKTDGDDSVEDVTENNTSSNKEVVQHGGFYRSVRFCLILMFTTVIIASVTIITIVWASSFGASLSQLTVQNRDHEFSKLKNHIFTTLDEIVQMAQTVNHLMRRDFDIRNFDLVSSWTYQLFKLESELRPEVVVTMYMGDVDRNSVGIYVGEQTYFFSMWDGVNPRNETYLWQCEDFEKNEYCVRNKEPDEIDRRYGLSGIEWAQQRVGKTSFVPSYISYSIVFLTIVTSVPNVTDPSHLSSWFMYDLSVESFSSYLKDAIAHLTGSVAFVLETSTEYIIATSFPDIPVFKKISQYQYDRFKGNQFSEPTIKQVSNSIYEKYTKLTNIPCNEISSFSLDSNFVSLVRVCTNQDLDWTLILAVPQWFYLGQMIIAIIVALVFSVLIVGIGGVSGAVFAVRIIKPFYDLVVMFASVAQMDLDSVKVKQSFFSEVSTIQTSFSLLVDRLRLYRAFLPPHLLQELDKKSIDIDQKETNNNDKGGSSTGGASFELVSRESFRSSRHMSMRRSKAEESIKSMKSGHGVSRFDLGLESRDISILGFKFQFLEHVAANELIEISSEVFNLLEQTTNISKGQIGSFENGFISISWNSASECKNHIAKSVSTAEAIMKKVQDLKNKWGSKHMAFSSTLDSQKSMCGNVGTKNYKTFSIMGPISGNIQYMADLALKYEVPILVTKRVRDEVEKSYQNRFITNAELSFFEKDQFVFGLSYDKFKKDNIAIYEIGEKGEVNMDEWMYELEAKERKGKWKQYNTACDLIAESQFNQALNELNEFASKNPHDIPTKELIEFCKNV